MKALRNLGIALAAIGMPFAAQAQDTATPDIEMWRLDCGAIAISDLDAFADGYLYEGREGRFTNSCYLIRNGDRHLLWDAGLPSALIDGPVTQGIFTVSLERNIASQLAEIDVAVEDIDFLGLSHHHFDHVGQSPDFAASTLLLNARDVAALREGLNPQSAQILAPWLAGDAAITDFSGDHDVFGDGSVVILAMPGHTPGHSSLLVRLPETGNVLLTGDLYHFREQIENRGIPRFNTDRADTLASFERFLQIDQALDAMIVIQHDPGDLERLPAFPESAH
ncbi:MAG: N-acyl homoserine lactonase family protein [Pseudomonadota bacterium]